MKIGNKKAQLDIAGGIGIVMLFMLFIVGMILYVVVAGVIEGQTNTVARFETGLALNSTNNVVLANVPVNSISNVVNVSTGDIVLTNPANYTFTSSNGTVVPGAALSNGAQPYNFTYTSEPAGFVSNATQRTLVLILPILFLVLLIMMVLGLGAFKKTG
ncbi:hypothetical protein LCGC14_0484930 [marine sediment metagenome]|uniref:Uncharacterized protein n=1 Tax=marine sediment metagenome TaxID=412755 RepID=A0A0F9S870_9ZZZZ